MHRVPTFFHLCQSQRWWNIEKCLKAIAALHFFALRNAERSKGLFSWTLQSEKFKPEMTGGTWAQKVLSMSPAEFKGSQHPYKIKPTKCFESGRVGNSSNKYFLVDEHEKREAVFKMSSFALYFNQFDCNELWNNDNNTCNVLTIWKRTKHNKVPTKLPVAFSLISPFHILLTWTLTHTCSCFIDCI